MRNYFILVLSTFTLGGCDQKTSPGDQGALENPAPTEFVSSLLGTWTGTSLNHRGVEFQWEFRLTPERRFSLIIAGQELAFPEEISGRWSPLEKGESASQYMGGWIAKQDYVYLFPDEAGAYFYQLEIDEEMAKHGLGYPVLVSPRENEKMQFYFDDCDAELAPHLVTAEKVEQVGTGQPANRPESKSEGGDKPQPEAEGRSR